MRNKHRLLAGAAALALTGSITTAALAGNASASPQPATVHATTNVKDRPDSGAAADWADDTMTRSIVITRTGGTPGAYTFTAKLTDKGTFTMLEGALTPNQSGPYAGQVIKSTVTGTLKGYADFSFTATALPSASPNAGVPATENDHGLDPADSTSGWYELAFPPRTTFGGAGIGAWSWKYGVTVITVTHRKVCFGPHFCVTIPSASISRQHWTDAYDNGGGDQPGDGNVTG